MMEWQPIETAPKDGTPIIMAGAGWSYPGLWVDGATLFGGRTRNYWGLSGWFDLDEDWLTTKPNEGVTHWMPLPEPPKA